jgi:acyl-CoA synthetase (AMP-forming)/AMP-acid ligase II
MSQGIRIGYQKGSSIHNNVITYLEGHNERYPERIALRWAKMGATSSWNGEAQTGLAHEEISYRDFTSRIRHFAGGLKKLGIEKGDRVIIFLPMGVDMYTAMFAVQRIGAIAVFLDSWARSHHLGASAECVGPKAMISSDRAFQIVNQVREFDSMPFKIIWGPGEGYRHHFREILACPEEAPIEAVESETTALITFTTGSSGKPKGANRTHRFLSAQHEALSKVVPYEASDLDMPAFPIFSLNNLASGVSTLLPGLDLANPSSKDSAILASQILSEKVTCATLSPSMLVGLSRFAIKEGLTFKSLRRVATGGAPISKDDVKEFYQAAPQSELWILYGSTEVEPMAHIEGHDMIREDKASGKDPEIVEEGVNVGHISDDLRFKFIRIHKDPIDFAQTSGWESLEVAPGKVGEFLVSGDHVCESYYNNEEAFFKTKIRDSDGRVWHRTGDLAYVDSQRQLWIVGRVHNAIERQGELYFPVRAEVLLKRIAMVEQAAFLGIEDKALTEKTVVAVKIRDSASGPEAKKEIERIFAKNSIPVDEIYAVAHVPMDPRHHSKVEYGVLKEMILRGEAKRL